jgi:hypothetical protein
MTFLLHGSFHSVDQSCMDLPSRRRNSTLNQKEVSAGKLRDLGPIHCSDFMHTHLLRASIPLIQKDIDKTRRQDTAINFTPALLQSDDAELG